MLIRLGKNQRKVVQRSDHVYEVIRNYLLKQDKIDQLKEHFFVAALKMNHEIRYIEVVSIGTLKSTLASPTEIFRRAIMRGNVSSIILAHNHPSGNTNPSASDTKLTNRIVKAGELLEIQVLDHLIVTIDNGYYSYADNNRINI